MKIFISLIGDGVGTIDISKLAKFHFEQSGIVTLTQLDLQQDLGESKDS